MESNVNNQKTVFSDARIGGGLASLIKSTMQGLLRSYIAVAKAYFLAKVYT